MRDRSEPTDLERVLGAVLEQVAEAAVVTDPEGVVLGANPSYGSLTGRPPEEAIGRSAFAPSAGIAEAVVEELWTGLRESGRFEGEVRLLGEGGAAARSLTVTAVADAAGRTTHLVAVFREVVRGAPADSRLEHARGHDPLTGLPDRLLLLDRLARAVAAAREQGRGAAVLLLDLDRFQHVNETLGHRAGDHVLVTVAARLEGAAPLGSSVFRVGGDEFAVVVPAVASARHAAGTASAILSALRDPVEVAGKEVYARASGGLALFPSNGAEADELLRSAGTAMRRARETGGDQYRFFAASMNDNALERLETEAALRRGIAEGELRLHYQPQVSPETGRIVGLEALVRWERPGHGLVEPAAFLALAEECGAIVALDDWVLRRACEQGAAWLRAGLPPVTIGVNQSAARFRDRRLASVFATVLEETGLPPSALCLEITEGTVMDDIETTRRTLARLAELGVHVAMDDFGTGYSSLANLKRLAVDALKIPGSFVDGVTTDADDRAIAEAILAMGKALGLAVVAEGVETLEQLAALRERRCDLIQGHVYARAEPPERIEPLLAAGHLEPAEAEP